MAENSNTGPLSVGSSHARSFPQTGSWSMVDIAKLPVSATIGVLSRYCAGRVNPYTVLVGQALCKGFHLSTKGRQNVEQALSSLQAIGSLGKVLYFGFGIEDLVRSMAQTEEGSVCLVLCAALADCYHEDVAVEVLLELQKASTTSIEDEYKPSSFEWKALLRACSGTLSASELPTRAETFMAFCQNERRLGGYSRLDALPKSVRRCSSPKSIANALIGLSRISQRSLHPLQAITIMGGADAGWLAAVAEWLLDLKVSISSSAGELIYTNHEDLEYTNVRILFRQEDNTTGIQDLALKDGVFLLEDGSELIQEENNESNADVVSGRVAWKSALTQSYMADFRKLMGMPQAFSEAIGSAARIFMAIATADKAIPAKHLSGCISYCPQSYGTGFVNHTIDQFPELEKLRENAQKSSKCRLKDARRTYEACLNKFRTVCQCATCKSSWTGFDVSVSEDVDDEMPDIEETESTRPSTDTGSIDDWDPDLYCLVILVETIICVSRTLANVKNVQGLSPTRVGFDIAYGRQLNLRRSANLGRAEILEMGPIVFCLDFDKNISWSVEEDTAEVRLYSVLELFAGRSPLRTRWGVSALCINGICAYLEILANASEHSHAVGSIIFLPGRISYQKRSYTSLEDQILLKQPGESFEATAFLAKPDIRYEKPGLRIRERANALQCLLRFHLEGEAETSTTLVGPAKLANMLATRQGLVSCKRKGNCPESADAGDLQQAVESRNPIQLHQKTISFLRCESFLTAIPVLASAAHLDPRCSIYIVDHQCLQCCVTTAISVDRPERDMFCFLFTPDLG